MNHKKFALTVENFERFSVSCVGFHWSKEKQKDKREQQMNGLHFFFDFSHCTTPSVHFIFLLREEKLD